MPEPTEKAGHSGIRGQQGHQTEGWGGQAWTHRAQPAFISLEMGLWVPPCPRSLKASPASLAHCPLQDAGSQDAAGEAPGTAGPTGGRAKSRATLDELLDTLKLLEEEPEPLPRPRAYRKDRYAWTDEVVVGALPHPSPGARRCSPQGQGSVVGTRWGLVGLLPAPPPQFLMAYGSMGAVLQNSLGVGAPLPVVPTGGAL